MASTIPADDNTTPPATPDSSSALPAAVSWEEDENSTTLFLRALLTLAAGAFLSWSQARSGIKPGAEWGRWVALSATANFLLPVMIVWFFFGQGLRQAPWLKDERLNAWYYGWKWSEVRRHLQWAGGMTLVMLPVLWLQSSQPEFRAAYGAYFPPVPTAGAWLYLVASLTLYMFCWEWFHRGFLLFGMAQGFGPVPAIIVQAVLFGLAHFGKPAPEVAGSFAGGLILGVVAWRSRSFAPAFYTHALIHVVWAILVLRPQP